MQISVFFTHFFFSPITTDPADEISPLNVQLMSDGCQGRENSKKSQVIGWKAGARCFSQSQHNYMKSEHFRTEVLSITSGNTILLGWGHGISFTKYMIYESKLH